MTSHTALRSEQSGSCIRIARGFYSVRTQRADESHKLPDTVGVVEEAGHFRAWNAFGNVFQEVGIARSVVKAASSEVGPSSPLARIAVTWRAVRMKGDVVALALRSQDFLKRLRRLMCGKALPRRRL